MIRRVQAVRTWLSILAAGALLGGCLGTTPPTKKPAKSPKPSPTVSATEKPVTTPSYTASPAGPTPTVPSATGAIVPGDPIQAIKHVVVVMQENRSFDTYFGTFPGADGIPMVDGKPTQCSPTLAGDACIFPYHDTADAGHGGPHRRASMMADIDGGAFDGFVAQQQSPDACKDAGDPAVCGLSTDTMSWHDDREIPNYWSYAKNFVLQDRMFESANSWSVPSHLYLVSEWSAICSRPRDPMSCVGDLNPDFVPGPRHTNGTITRPDYAWTDLTWLLHGAGVSWAYYVAEGTQPDCYDDNETCVPSPQTAATPQTWNPLPYFDTVHDDGEVGNVQGLDNFYAALAGNTLPAVSWIAPSNEQSEHAPNRISAGQAYVTHLINSVMQSPEWDSTAIFLAWDEWGGFYDHVTPPSIDGAGYGMRVPGLVISPYAKTGYIDHQTLSFDAYVKFIEDDFLGGDRIDPLTDGRPDPRPGVRENDPRLGDLRLDFDFTAPPRSPVILDENPPTDLQ